MGVRAKENKMRSIIHHNGDGSKLRLDQKGEFLEFIPKEPDTMVEPVYQLYWAQLIVGIKDGIEKHMGIKFTNTAGLLSYIKGFVHRYRRDKDRVDYVVYEAKEGKPVRRVILETKEQFGGLEQRHQNSFRNAKFE